MIATIFPASVKLVIANSGTEYIIGGVISLIILGYLIYTLIKPERF